MTWIKYVIDSACRTWKNKINPLFKNDTTISLFISFKPQKHEFIRV